MWCKRVELAREHLDEEIKHDYCGRTIDGVKFFHESSARPGRSDVVDSPADLVL